MEFFLSCTLYYWATGIWTNAPGLLSICSLLFTLTFTTHSGSACILYYILSHCWQCLILSVYVCLNCCLNLIKLINFLLNIFIQTFCFCTHLYCEKINYCRYKRFYFFSTFKTHLIITRNNNIEIIVHHICKPHFRSHFKHLTTIVEWLTRPIDCLWHSHWSI